MKKIDAKTSSPNRQAQATGSAAVAEHNPSSSAPVFRMKTDRRDFLMGAAVFGAAAATTAAFAASSDETAGAKDEKAAKRRLGMVIDLRRCAGCSACAVACKAENGVRLGGFRCRVRQTEADAYPGVKRYFLPLLCNHCDEPACVPVCPVKATYKRPDGIVEIDVKKCIGCKRCIKACPYNARYFNPEPDPEAKSFPARTHKKADKCSFCAHRVENGLEPACVSACPARARIFGDLNDSKSKVSELVNTQSPRTLWPEHGTKPNVFYIALADAAHNKDMRMQEVADAKS